jgi:glycosyltransferase involved in cell wall biosynthesis
MISPLKSKKIVLLLSNDITYDQRVFRIASTLEQRGAEVTVLGRLLPHSISVHWPNITTKRFSISAQSGPLMYAQLNQKLASFGRSQPWDIVVSNDFDTLLAGYRIASKSNAAWVLDAHEHFIEVPELQGRNTKRYIWHALGLWAAKRLDAAYTVSDSLSRLLSLTYGIEFLTIENRPIFKDLNLTKDKPIKNILYQGALNRGRGLDTAILAMQDLPHCKLQFAGEGYISDELKALVRRYSLEDRVEFLGRISPGALDEVTASAWLGINLLEGGSLNYYYSLANKFFDYAQLGIPSLNPNFPEYQRYIDKYNAGLIMDSITPYDFKHLVYGLMEDEAKYSGLRNGALRMKEDCHWASQEDALCSIYESLV